MTRIIRVLTWTLIAILAVPMMVALSGIKPPEWLVAQGQWFMLSAVALWAVSLVLIMFQSPRR